MLKKTVIKKERDPVPILLVKSGNVGANAKEAL